MTFHSRNPEETHSWAIRLAKKLKPGDILCLYGNLGSGKTTFVKGLAEGLKIKPNSVSSPTFVLMNAYDGRLALYHFDFYRIEHQEEIVGIGYDEFLFGKGVAVVEWAERFGKYLPPERLDLHFDYVGETGRTIRVAAIGERYERLIKEL